MSSTDHFLTIEAPATGEFRDRGSKFIAYAFPATSETEALELLEPVRREHPKARHYCYAYRLGLDGNRFRANDDGEPSGTAGRPILGQIDSFGLTDVFIVVVRYFGGTLLGTSGLIQAYRETAAQALSQARIVERVIEDRFTLCFEYALMGNVMSAIERLQLSQLDQRFAEKAEVDIAIRRSEVAPTLRRLRALVAEVYLEEVTDDFTLEGFAIQPAH